MEEIEVVKKLYRGAYDSHGAQFVAGGLPLGSELRWPVPETPTGHSMSEMMVLPDWYLPRYRAAPVGRRRQNSAG